MNDSFSYREKIVIKLILCLIKFVGKDMDGFFPYSVEEIFKDKGE